MATPWLRQIADASLIIAARALSGRAVVVVRSTSSRNVGSLLPEPAQRVTDPTEIDTTTPSTRVTALHISAPTDGRSLTRV